MQDLISAMLERHGLPPEPDPFPRAYKIESPVSAEEMCEQSDGDILSLFAVLDDNQEHHPDDFMKGGSVEASLEFGRFAIHAAFV